MVDKKVLNTAEARDLLLYSALVGLGRQDLMHGVDKTVESSETVLRRRLSKPAVEGGMKALARLGLASKGADRSAMQLLVDPWEELVQFASEEGALVFKELERPFVNYNAACVYAIRHVLNADPDTSARQVDLMTTWLCMDSLPNGREARVRSHVILAALWEVWQEMVKSGKPGRLRFRFVFCNPRDYRTLEKRSALRDDEYYDFESSMQRQQLEPAGLQSQISMVHRVQTAARHICNSLIAVRSLKELIEEEARAHPLMEISIETRVFDGWFGFPLLVAGSRQRTGGVRGIYSIAKSAAATRANLCVGTDQTALLIRDFEKAWQVALDHNDPVDEQLVSVRAVAGLLDRVESVAGYRH